MDWLAVFRPKPTPKQSRADIYLGEVFAASREHNLMAYRSAWRTAYLCAVECKKITPTANELIFIDGSTCFAPSTF